ncbi:MAG: hypothetical protein WCU00_14360 [Candidatus Latescibacterota bacterium]
MDIINMTVHIQITIIMMTAPMRMTLDTTAIGIAGTVISTRTF